MRMIIRDEETHFYGSVNGLTIYASNFDELEDSAMQYHVRLLLSFVQLPLSLCILQRFWNRPTSILFSL
jgi:hypothetical protein